MFDDENLSILQVNPELIAGGYVAQAAQAPGYDRIYRAAINGLFPTTRVGRRLSVCRSDLPKVAAAFGLAPTSAASAPHALAESAA